MNIKVLLADDQALVLGALAALLELEPDLSVVAKVTRGDHVLAAVREHQPDVCLLDIEMPGLNGIEVAALLAEQAPATKAAIVTTFGRPGYLQRAMESGARGFLVKDTPATELAIAVRRIHEGQTVIDPTLAVESVRLGSNPLSQRETQVLKESLRGESIDVIAATLHLSAGTVRNHISSAITKTGTNNRVEAAIIANEAGWL
ncbi:response regulator transcription factor [Actinomycetaceae bacterium TAE3-ERU4]|nr:response regulator transcription factor [Actinomycetaceae bacterium TAE3-ERU4]